VAPGSAAAAAGLRPGDRIVALNGRVVQRAGEVIRGVRLHPDAQPLVITVDRGGQRLDLKLRLPPSSDPRLAARDNGANA
jgi:regulator of sigma E protease